ncbi:MAG: DUF1343 domain-containing protein [Ignavibacteria bacterium CG_4_8_14_3_um_filter_37_9]|nr:MAG: DUF1343 domain-containing protein [Ignavibacteria bacterium CG_4_8_14_3_um_filter_37_9]
MIYIFMLVTLFFLQSIFGQTGKNNVVTGADRLLSENIDFVEGRKLGIVTNHTAVLSNGTHLIDALFDSEFRIKITALFGPEHGLRGQAQAGENVENLIDEKTRVPIYSLYGKDKKPTKEMLKNVNMLIFDMQDAGARFYTYLSTLYYSLQAAAENNIPILVLDRPNPIGGIYVDGPIRQDSLNSFVGIIPVPIAHGMTFGELANYINDENLLGNNLHAELAVMKMRNWKRNYFFEDLNLQWIKPSPNITNLNTAMLYPGTCLIEGTNISEGRGTDEPFLTIGAPFIKPNQLVKALRKFKFKGLTFAEASFTPKDIPNVSVNPKYEGKLCRGISIKVTDKTKVESVKFGIALISVLHKLYPKEFLFKEKSFDLLSGDSKIRRQLVKNISPDKINKSYLKELTVFKEKRKKYLLY